ncbi:MAG: hypothetical protein ACE5HI_20620, partial [bacterium]
MHPAKVYSFFLPLTLLLAFTSFVHTQEAHLFNKINQEYHRVLRLVGKEQYDTAIQGLKRIIAQDSSFYRAYIKMVEVYKYKKDLDAAQKYFETKIKIEPNNPYAQHALGLVYKGMQEYQKAYSSILKSIQLDLENYAAYPDFVSVHRDLEEA